MDESVEMARVAAAQGTKAILATPHRKDVTELHSVAQARTLLDELNAEIRAESVGLEVLLGMENHLDPDLPVEIAAGRALPMNGTSHVLVELPFFGTPAFIVPTLHRIQAAGLVPVLAHPERIEAFQQDPDLLAGFVRGGMLGQITAGSLLGHFGLLCSGLHRRAADTWPRTPDGVGHPRARGPALARPDREGVQAASEIVGAQKAHDLVDAVPRSILHGRQASRVSLPP